MAEALTGERSGLTFTTGAADVATEVTVEPGIGWCTVYADGGELKLAHAVANGDGGAMAAAEVAVKIADGSAYEFRIGQKNRSQSASFFVASTAGAIDAGISSEPVVES